MRKKQAAEDSYAYYDPSTKQFIEYKEKYDSKQAKKDATDFYHQEQLKEKRELKKELERQNEQIKGSHGKDRKLNNELVKIYEELTQQYVEKYGEKAKEQQ